MLTIRREQMEKFEEASRRRLEEDMLEHLRNFAPALCRAAGEPGSRQAVRLGCERARRYGFTEQGPVRLYLELMVVLGSDFDSDPQLYWAAETLTDSSLADQTARSGLLYERSCWYLDEVAGPNNRYGLEALRRLELLNFRDATAKGPVTDDSIVRTMYAVYPEKAAFAGETVLRALVRQGAERAGGFSMPTIAGAALMAGLMFGFGHGVCTDPLYPWIAATLKDERIADAGGRAERLLDKVKVYARHAAGHLTEK